MDQDPIIKSMQDNRPEPPKQDVGPAPKPPIGTPEEPKKGLGNPPASEATKISYKAPEPPKSITPDQNRGGRDAAPPASGKMPELPKPMKSLHEEHVKLPKNGDVTPKVNLALIIVTILLLVMGSFVLFNKIGGFEETLAENDATAKKSLEEMNAKLDLTIQKIQEDELRLSQMKQQLFDAGAALQKAADELVTEGEKLAADGDVLKKEGEATEDQAKIDRGQNQIDRGNAMQEHGKAYDEQGKEEQEKSGMDGNK
jgi:hypothetical protein